MPENISTNELAFALIEADTEAEVVAVLTKAGYWDNPAVWRDYGDVPNNVGTITNQQADPIASVAEKITNSFDAVLFNQARTRGAAMQGEGAPQNVAQAVQQLILGSSPDHELKQIQDLPEYVRREWQNKIAITVTGSKTSPSLSIVDEGEGQIPSLIPATFLSLIGSNKVRIPFAHGKFNMGGTGALQFSSPKHKLQFILTRRNPALTDAQSAQTDDALWGFSVVRKEREHDRGSTYRYLAPVGSDQNPARGAVLSFAADTLELMPEHHEPYKRPVAHGTLIKLYEYQMPARWDATQSDGLLGRLENLLPEPALPFQIHECRGYAKKGNALFRGVIRRVQDNAENWLEPGFPMGFPLTVHGEKFNVSIHVAQQEAYRGRLPSGIFYTVNGQTHSQHDSRFFARDDVRLGYLQKSLFVSVDCSQVGVNGLEDLFLASRDRMRDSELKNDLVDALGKAIGENAVLKRLNSERRDRVLREKSSDQQVLTAALQDIIKNLPHLALRLGPGQRLNSPLMPETPNASPYVGKYFPTFFEPKVGRRRGPNVERVAAPDARIKWTFETDAQNDYFSRSKDTGKMEVLVAAGDDIVATEDMIGPSLNDGQCSVTFQVPEALRKHPSLEVLFSITDPQRCEPFSNTAVLALRENGPKSDDVRPKPSDHSRDKKPKERLDIPSPVLVHKNEWHEHTPPFTGATALRIKQKPEGGYDYFVNADNTHLLRHIDCSKANPSQAEFDFGMAQTLIGFSLINNESHDILELAASEVFARQQKNSSSIEDRVEQITGSIAQIIMPLLQAVRARHAENIIAPERPHRAAHEGVLLTADA
jgi:hypothetical protein